MPREFTAPAAFTDKAYTHIPMTPVSSNQVGAIGYDPATKTLACTFTRGPGHIYHYPNVEPDTHAAFISAESKGTFFGNHIRTLPFDKFPSLAEQEKAKAAAAGAAAGVTA